MLILVKRDFDVDKAQKVSEYSQRSGAICRTNNWRILVVCQHSVGYYQ